MALLKGLLATTIGLVSVLLFCGSMSGVVERGSEEFYSLSGTEFMLGRGWTCIIWFIMFLFLAFFVAFVFLYLKGGLNISLLTLFGVLHTGVLFLVFRCKAYLVGIILLACIVGIYIYLSMQIVRKKPKFVFLSLPYLIWLSYLFSVLYSVVLTN